MSQCFNTGQKGAGSSKQGKMLVYCGSTTRESRAVYSSRQQGQGRLSMARLKDFVERKREREREREREYDGQDQE